MYLVMLCKDVLFPVFFLYNFDFILLWNIISILFELSVS